MSVSESSTPLTVTVLVVFQLPVVKVRLAGDAVAAPVSSDVTPTVTLALGCVASFTVKVPLPASSYGQAREGVNTRFAVSSSVTLTLTEPVLPA